MTDCQNSTSLADFAPDDPEALQQGLAAQKGAYLRLAADFDNFRKRSRRDSQQQAAVEKENFIHELLPVLDNLELALTCERSIACEELRKGVEMTLQQLVRLLGRHGIEATEDADQPFDAHRHEALSVRRDPGRPDHVVLEVLQRGYARGDTMFRPAKVIVNDLCHSPGASRGR